MSLVSALKAPLGISNAIKKAAQATGADFSYLLKTAARESSFKQTAKAKTSSAAGLFQFIESTWLKTVKEAGNRFGLDKYTPHIFKTRGGRHYVPNPKLRQEILQLRHNPEVSAVMAGAFTQKNSEYVAAELGRDPTQGELYIAHFLGPKGASDLISLAEKRPNARADRHFPRAARANKSIFYSRGRPRSASQVYKELVSDHAKLLAVAATPASTAPRVAAATPAKPAIARAAAEPVKQAALAPERAKAPVLVREVKQVRATDRAQIPDPARVGDKILARQSKAPVPRDIAAAGPLAVAPAQKAATVAQSNAAEKSIGLLGHKGSPIAPLTKVAALTPGSNATGPKTISDAVPGSIGVWTTNIRLPEETPPAAQPGASSREEEAAPVKKRAARRNQNSRPYRLLEQDSMRRARNAAARPTAAPARQSAANFWHEMSLNGS